MYPTHAADGTGTQTEARYPTGRARNERSNHRFAQTEEGEDTHGMVKDVKNSNVEAEQNQNEHTTSHEGEESVDVKSMVEAHGSAEVRHDRDGREMEPQQVFS